MHSNVDLKNSPMTIALFVIIFLAGISLIISVISLHYISLSVISSKSNEIYENRTSMAVQGAIQTNIDKIYSLVLDNSIRDDVVNHTYGKTLDTNWLFNTWGAGYKINHLYDGIFVLDQNFNVLWGSLYSSPIKLSDIDFFGNGLRALITKNQEQLQSGKALFSGITRTQEGVAFIGIGLIRPVIGGLQQFDGTRRYLVITRHLNAESLMILGRLFQIDNLSLSQNYTGTIKVPLLSSASETLGYFNWTPNNPGAEAARAASQDFNRVIFLAVGLILIFIALSSLGLYKLVRGEQRAQATALTDWLTQLPNRRVLINRLEVLSAQHDPHKKIVVFIDLDGFKDVNDVYGHDVGDRLIIAVANILLKRVPPRATLARMGGDEFALLQEGSQGATQSLTFAGQVLELLSQPIMLDDRIIHISASIGIAAGNMVECSSSELFRRADIAMYHSKTTGKGRITHYDAMLNNAREHQLRVENDIRNGLANDEFEVWYQPIISAQNMMMIGVEALVRWPRRPGGPLPPDEFIGVAETSGLIYTLGQFVLRRACRDMLPLCGLHLSVNISPAQFRDPEFEYKVSNVLVETGFPAHRLQLEVTETYVLESPERAKVAIDNLKALGTSIALDDFGTGYASIGYLRRFNFDTIKIDKSLAGLVDSDSQAAALVEGTVRIATALGMTITAEGVEIPSQVELLRQAGCKHLQGYYFSKPLPLKQLIEFSRMHSPLHRDTGEVTLFSSQGL